MTVTLFEVGGHVRDSLLGIKSKDIDYAVEADSFDEMLKWIQDRGFKVFQVKPEFATVRAQSAGGGRFYVPSGLTADFVLCRKDGEYTDGRRPDSVEPGNLFDDLGRRDFTVNAMARDLDGKLIDPWGGQGDLNLKRLRCVGNAEDRIREDSLRALRAIRFCITKRFWPDWELWDALNSDWLPPLLSNVSRERIREELNKCFKADTVGTLATLSTLPLAFTESIFTDGLRLDATLAS